MEVIQQRHLPWDGKVPSRYLYFNLVNTLYPFLVVPEILFGSRFVLRAES